MAKKTVDTASEQPAPQESSIPTHQLIDALMQAINATKPVQNKTMFTRKPNTPWTPKDGSPMPIMKRVYMQHGQPMERVSAEDIVLLNQLKPGKYCDGYVTVTRRKDKAIDIDYPIRTRPQLLKLSSMGITSTTQLLQRIVDEAKNPKAYKSAEELEDL